MHLELDIATDDGVSAPLGASDLTEVAEVVLREEGITRPCFISLSIVSDEHMHELNATWRGIDAPTDVLSLECERPNDAQLAPDEPCELGDIVLAPTYIARQAQEFGVSVRSEFTLMFIHGLLHLLGYDHLTTTDAERMEAREDELLARALHQPIAHVTTTRHHADRSAAHDPR